MNTVTPNIPTINIFDEDDDISHLSDHNQYSDEDSDLQLAIMASLSTATPNTSIIENPFDGDEDPSLKKRKNKLFTVTETGESWNSKSSSSSDKIYTATFMCEICVEPKSYNESFLIMGCAHSFCFDCVIKYVASKLQENIPQIGCPVSGCFGLLEPEYCRNILPPELFDSWGKSFCEAVIPGSEKLYCPHTDCSALLIDDDREGGRVSSQVECPNCSRWFCADCKVSWHWNMECADFQRMDEDEREEAGIMFKQLAEEKRWIRCPNCRFYVEKTLGCNTVYCRCGRLFCYGCGEHTCKCSGVLSPHRC
ncbi:E3 ubiquitin-protein ligase RSL1-like [Cornus florida]|uniref:E3 ubiquitin-protein ligase RSL1-like n=1 Tax=Cornus florida TaxID=4283 RepID=UPI0028966E6A|nr:E3 ubiquitin-protein ligase RSL1-like [Cornus florida]